MKIKISKSQWQYIGRKTGWSKQAVKMNEVNNGSPINSGIQATPNSPTSPTIPTSEETKQSQDVMADIDASENLTTNQWKSQLNDPSRKQEKGSLEGTPNEMARKITEQLNFIKNPKEKATFQRLIDTVAQDPKWAAKADMVFKNIVKRINRVVERQNTQALQNPKL